MAPYRFLFFDVGISMFQSLKWISESPFMVLHAFIALWAMLDRIQCLQPNGAVGCLYLVAAGLFKPSMTDGCTAPAPNHAVT